jgi:hypothetical protein
MARGFSTEERRAIANGEFFTAAELAAKPHLRRYAGRYATRAPGQPADPNDRPMTAKERAAVEAMVQVCAYCREPGDDRSALDDDSYHPECAEAWAQEVAARKAAR